MNPRSLRGSRTGVFVGCWVSESETNNSEEVVSNKDLAFTMTGSMQFMFANRLSYFFDFHGPSFKVDTACSSSLLALQLAVDAIRQGHCDAALVAGSNLTLSSTLTLALHNFGLLSPSGSCQSFDANGETLGQSEELYLFLSFQAMVMSDQRELGPSCSRSLPLHTGVMQPWFMQKVTQMGTKKMVSPTFFYSWMQRIERFRKHAEKYHAKGERNRISFRLFICTGIFRTRAPPSPQGASISFFPSIRLWALILGAKNYFSKESFSDFPNRHSFNLFIAAKNDYKQKSFLCMHIAHV